MNQLTIPYKNKVYLFSFANSWQEVPKKALPYIGKHLWDMVALYKEGIAAHSNEEWVKSNRLDQQLQFMRIQVLRRLCNISRWPFIKRNRAFYSMEADEVASALESTNFLFTDLKVAQPYKTIRWWLRHYIGPSENLNNISGEEFHFAEILFHKATAGNREAACQLVALLYRRPGSGPKHNPNHRSYCGDQRESFNRHSFDLRYTRLKSLPDAYVYSILLWFASCRAQIMANYPHIFKGGSEKTNADGWMPVFRALAKSPLHFEEVASMRLSFILWELTEIKREADDAKQQLKKT